VNFGDVAVIRPDGGRIFMYQTPLIGDPSMVWCQYMCNKTVSYPCIIIDTYVWDNDSESVFFLVIMEHGVGWINVDCVHAA